MPEEAKKKKNPSPERAKMRAAIDAIAEAMGEQGGSAQKAARIAAIAVQLKAGKVKGRGEKGKERPINAAKTALLVAKLLKLGGQPADVPEEIRSRYSWKDVSPQLLELAKAHGVEAKAMLTSFGLRVPAAK